MLALQANLCALPAALSVCGIAAIQTLRRRPPYVHLHHHHQHGIVALSLPTPPAVRSSGQRGELPPSPPFEFWPFSRPALLLVLLLCGPWSSMARSEKHARSAF